ncbi:MAG: hypothetical protein WC858_01345 [Parcubacteria group bacterium]|jgi:hypothetical protein
MIERKKSLIYSELEKKIPEMQLASQKGMQFSMSSEAEKYLEGFRDKISSTHSLNAGKDSTVYLVKLEGFEDRTQLVKVYDNLERRLKKKKDLVPVLKEYYEVMRDVQKYLVKNINPLNKKIKIEKMEYSPEFSVSQCGILIEKNNQVGSWIRSWIPGKNFNENMSEISGRWKISDYVDEVCNHLSEVFGYNINPGMMNYKVLIDHREKKIKITFTDLANNILDFVDFSRRL